MTNIQEQRNKQNKHTSRLTSRLGGKVSLKRAPFA